MTALSYHNPITDTEETCTLDEAVAAMDIAPSSDDRKGFADLIDKLENEENSPGIDWLCRLDRIFWRQRRAIMGDMIRDEFNNLTDEELVATEKTYAAYLHVHGIVEEKIKE